MACYRYALLIKQRIWRFTLRMRVRCFQGGEVRKRSAYERKEWIGLNVLDTIGVQLSHDFWVTWLSHEDRDKFFSDAWYKLGGFSRKNNLPPQKTIQTNPDCKEIYIGGEGVGYWVHSVWMVIKMRGHDVCLNSLKEHSCIIAGLWYKIT